MSGLIKMIKVKCKNPKCGHEWNYKGTSKFYVTCPHCYNKTSLRVKKKD